MLSVFNFDVKSNQVREKNIYPTDVVEDTIHWLYANNNKYPDSIINSDKVGKWMLFVHSSKVNSVWDKVKKGIVGEQLWHAKVSTANQNPIHAIMIYTKDYTDVADVIHVLNYLEEAEISPKYKQIHYKTDEQTRAGIYSGGPKKPWIYDSRTIRSIHSPTASLPSVDRVGSSRAGLYVIPALRRRVDTSEQLIPPGNSSMQPMGSFPK